MSIKKLLLEVIVIPSSEHASPAVSQIIIELKDEIAMNEFKSSFISEERAFGVVIYRSFKML